MHLKLRTNHKPNLFKSRKMRRAEIQAPGEHRAPKTSSTTAPGEGRPEHEGEGADLVMKQQRGGGELSFSWPDDLNVHSTVMPWGGGRGDTFLQTCYFPLASYNYQISQNEIKFHSLRCCTTARKLMPFDVSLVLCVCDMMLKTKQNKAKHW